MPNKEDKKKPEARTPKLEARSRKTDDGLRKKAPRKIAAKKQDKKIVSDKNMVVEAESIAAAESVKAGSFIPALGRRKTSVARVRLIKNGKGAITINGRKLEDFFGAHTLRDEIESPLRAVGQSDSVDISALVNGGGIRGQAQAVRLGISRALVELNPTFRVVLKKLGYLTRDPRKRERKKFGKKSARRSPQWSKR